MKGLHCSLLTILLQSVNTHPPEHPRIHPTNKKVWKRDVSASSITEDKDFWLAKGGEELAAALGRQEIKNVAKNVIIFIGDGMSLPTVTAARILKGQQAAESLEEGFGEELAWEKFPNVGLSKTYCTSNMVSDSASTASAMYTGVKTTFYTMGYDGGIVSGDPSSTETSEELETMLDWAQAAGKKTGFVTTTRMSHATPAALYAKSVYRFWECDKELQEAIDDEDDPLITQEIVDKYHVKDISRQLVESKAGLGLDVMLGGGRASFLPDPNKTQVDRSGAGWDYDSKGDYWDCYRLDGRNLIDEWKSKTKGSYVESKSELMGLDHENTEKVLGIFTNSYVTWDSAVNETNDKPHLVDMATEAVKFLQAKSGDAGYFIMIEGGRIDSAHHNGNAAQALSETLALDKAVEEVLRIVDLEDTLVLITADHAHTMSIGGYPQRKQSVLGVVGSGKYDIGEDGKPFTVLSYGNGPGFKHNLVALENGDWTKIERQVNMTDGDQADLEYHQHSGVPLSSETHGGDDVGIWAAGPWAHLIHGVHQQSYIAQVMSYAACVGPHRERENCPDITRGSAAGERQGGALNIFLTALAVIVAVVAK